MRSIRAGNRERKRQRKKAKCFLSFSFSVVVDLLFGDGRPDWLYPTSYKQVYSDTKFYCSSSHSSHSNSTPTQQHSQPKLMAWHRARRRGKGTYTHSTTRYVVNNLPGHISTAGDDLIVVQKATTAQVTGVPWQLPAHSNVALAGFQAAKNRAQNVL